MTVVLFCMIFSSSVAGAEPPARFEFAETHMGSEFRIVLYSPDGGLARRAARAAFDRIAGLDAALSDYNPESELMRLCDRAGGPPVPVSPDLFSILQRSKALYERSGGAFDVTVGPAVRQWRRARRDRKMPTAENLARARSLTSSELMHLDPAARTVRLEKDGMKLDLGGIAKGWASDAAIGVLKEQGVTSALVAGAGDIVVSGPPPGEPGWVVGVAPLEDPGETPERYFSLRDAAVSTSGDAERFVEIDGRRYAHIVDPRTALGVVERGSVTVVSKDGGTSDALATAVFVLGPERGLALVEATPGAACLYVRKADGVVTAVESARMSGVPRAAPGELEGPAARLVPR